MHFKPKWIVQGLYLSLLIVKVYNYEFKVTVPSSLVVTLGEPAVSLSGTPGSQKALLSLGNVDFKWFTVFITIGTSSSARAHTMPNGPTCTTQEMQKGNTSLRLENVTMDDVGEYVCSVSSHLGSEKKSFPLKVSDLTLLVMSAERRTIPCKAQSVQGVQYLKISWHKVSQSEEEWLVIKNLHDNHTTILQGANNSYEVGKDLSLLLPESAMADCGTYQCILWPPQGHDILKGKYDYNPPDCITPMEALTTGSTLVTVARGHMGVTCGGVFLALILSAAGVVCFYRKYKTGSGTTEVEEPV